MTISMRWGGLRPEPYDPNARDADNDGIVQEGTPWERPKGTFIVTEFGLPIASGRVETNRPRGLKIIDQRGNTVDYTPSYLQPGGGEQRPPDFAIQHMGVPSLRDMGLPTIQEITAPPDVTPPDVTPEPQTATPADPTALTGNDGISGIYTPLFNQWFETPEFTPQSIEYTPTGAQHVAAKVRFDDPNARQMFGQTLNDLALIHGVPFDEDTEIVRVVTTEAPLDWDEGFLDRYGTYVGERATNAEWGHGSAKPDEPFGQVRILVSTDDETMRVGRFDESVGETVGLLSFLQGFGERLDFRADPDPEVPGGSKKGSWARRGTQAMQQFLTEVGALNQHQDRLDGLPDGPQRDAYLDPEKVFARFYAQWAASMLPTSRGSHRYNMGLLTNPLLADQHDDRHFAGLGHLYWFSGDELEKLSPAFEDALREMGIELQKDEWRKRSGAGSRREAVAAVTGETVPARADVLPEAATAVTGETVPARADVLPNMPGVEKPDASGATSGGKTAQEILAQRVDDIVPLNPDGSRTAAGIEARNVQVKEALEAAGGSLFKIDEKYLSQFPDDYDAKPVALKVSFIKHGTTAQQAEVRRSSAKSWFQSVKDGEETISDPELLEHIRSTDIDTLMEQFELATRAYYESLDPTIRIALDPEELERLLSDPSGRYKTTFEVNSEMSSADARTRVEVSFGYPEQGVPTELRPASGFVRHRGAIEKQAELFEARFGRPPEVYEEWGGEPVDNYAKANNVYGSMSLVLRPEVRERSAFAGGDSLRSRTGLAPLTDPTDDELMATLWNSEGTSFGSLLSQIMMPHIRGEAGIGVETYNEAVVAGSVDLRDVAEIETSTQFFTRSTALGGRIVLGNKIYKYRIQFPEAELLRRAGFTDEEIAVARREQILDEMNFDYAAEAWDMYTQIAELQQRVKPFGVKVAFKMKVLPGSIEETLAPRVAALADLSFEDAVEAEFERLSTGPVVDFVRKRLDELLASAPTP